MAFVNDYLSKFTDATKKPSAVTPVDFGPKPEDVRRDSVAKYVDAFSDSPAKLTGDLGELMGPEAPQVRRNRAQYEASRPLESTGLPHPDPYGGEVAKRDFVDTVRKVSLVSRPFASKMAEAAGIGLPMGNAPGASIRAGLPSPTRADAESVQWARDKGAEFVRRNYGKAYGANPFPGQNLDSLRGGKYYVGSGDESTQSLADHEPAPNQSEWLKDSYREPNTFGTLGEPTYAERVAVDVLGAPVMAPLGVANAVTEAVTGSGFMPQRGFDSVSMGLGEVAARPDFALQAVYNELASRAVAVRDAAGGGGGVELSDHDREAARRLADKVGIDPAAAEVAFRVLGRGAVSRIPHMLAASLGTTPDKLGFREGNGKGWYESLGAGVTNLLPEIGRMILGVAHLAGEGIELGQRDRDVGQRWDRAAKVALDVPSGFAAMGARTVLDPKRTLEEELGGTVLNAWALTPAWKGVAKPLTDSFRDGGVAPRVAAARKAFDDLVPLAAEKGVVDASLLAAKKGAKSQAKLTFEATKAARSAEGRAHADVASQLDAAEKLAAKLQRQLDAAKGTRLAVDDALFEGPRPAQSATNAASSAVDNSRASAAAKLADAKTMEAGAAESVRAARAAELAHEMSGRPLTDIEWQAARSERHWLKGSRTKDPHKIEANQARIAEIDKIADWYKGNKRLRAATKKAVADQAVVAKAGRGLRKAAAKDLESALGSRRTAGIAEAGAEGAISKAADFTPVRVPSFPKSKAATIGALEDQLRNVKQSINGTVDATGAQVKGLKELEREAFNATWTASAQSVVPFESIQNRVVAEKVAKHARSAAKAASERLYELERLASERMAPLQSEVAAAAAELESMRPGMSTGGVPKSVRESLTEARANLAAAKQNEAAAREAYGRAKGRVGEEDFFDLPADRAARGPASPALVAEASPKAGELIAPDQSAAMAIDAARAQQQADAIAWFEDSSPKPLAVETPDLVLEAANRAVADAKTPAEAADAAASLALAEARAAVLGDPWLDDLDAADDLGSTDALAYAQKAAAKVEQSIAETERAVSKHRSGGSAAGVKKYEKRLDELAQLKADAARAIDAAKSGVAPRPVVSVDPATVPPLAKVKAAEPSAAGAKPEPALRAEPDGIAKLQELRDAYQAARTARVTAEGVTHQFRAHQVHPDFDRFTINKNPAEADAAVAAAKATEKAAKSAHDAHARAIGEPVIGAKSGVPKDLRPKHVQELESLLYSHKRAVAALREANAEVLAGGGINPMTGQRDIGSSQNMVRVLEIQRDTAVADYNRIAKKHGLPKLGEINSETAKLAARTEIAAPRPMSAGPQAAAASRADAIATHKAASVAEQPSTASVATASADVQAAAEASAKAEAAVAEAAAAVRDAEAAAQSARLDGLPAEIREAIETASQKFREADELARSARQHVRATGQDAAGGDTWKYQQAAGDAALEAKAELGLAAKQAEAYRAGLKAEERALMSRKAAAERNLRFEEARLQRQGAGAVRELAIAERLANKAKSDAAAIEVPMVSVKKTLKRAAERADEFRANGLGEFNRAVDAARKSEAALKSSRFYEGVAKAIEGAPIVAATLGTSLLGDVMGLLVQRVLRQPGNGAARWLLTMRDGRIPAELTDYMRSLSGEATAWNARIHQAFHDMPKSATVKGADGVDRVVDVGATSHKWANMEHTLDEGGWGNPGNIRADVAGSRQWTVWDGTRGEFRVTEYGTAKLSELDASVAAKSAELVEIQKAMDATPSHDLALAAKYKNVEAALRADADTMGRFFAEQEVVNRYFAPLARESNALTAAFAEHGLLRDPSSVRPLDWPQVYPQKGPAKTIAEAESRALIRDAEKRFTDSAMPRPKNGTRPAEIGAHDPKAKLAQIDASRLAGNAMRQQRIPMSRRELEYGMSTKLEDAVSSMAQGIAQVQLRKLQRYMSERYARTADQIKMESQARAAIEGNRGEFRSGDVDAKYVTVTEDVLPNGVPKYGDLAGKSVPEDLFYEMANAQALVEQSHGWMNQLIRRVKAGKTVWSPTTHARNILTNVFLLAPMAGISLLNPANWPYYLDALRDRMTNKRSATGELLSRHGQGDVSMVKSELGIDPKNGPSVLKDDVGQFAERFKAAIERGGADPLKFFLELGLSGKQGAIDAVMPALKGAREIGPLRRNQATMKWSRTSSEWDELRKTLEPTPQLTAAGITAVTDIPRAVARGVWDLTKVPGETLGAVYNFADQIFRDALARKKLAHGATPAEAVAAAVKSFVDYAGTAGFVNLVRAPFAMVGRDGKVLNGTQTAYLVASNPFVSFLAAATPLFVQWMKANPVQAQTYKMITDYVGDQNLSTAGVDPKSASDMMRHVPAALQNKLTLLASIAPTMGRDDDGNLVALDTAFGNVVGGLVPSWNKYKNTFANSVNAIREVTGLGEIPFGVAPVWEAINNYDVNRKREVSDERGGSAADVANRLSHVVAGLAAPVAPSLTDWWNAELGTNGGTKDEERIGGGYWWEDAARAKTGEIDRFGGTVSPDRLIAKTFGLKTSPLIRDEVVRANTAEFYQAWESANRVAQDKLGTTMSYRAIEDALGYDPARSQAVQTRFAEHAVKHALPALVALRSALRDNRTPESDEILSLVYIADSMLGDRDIQWMQVYDVIQDAIGLSTKFAGEGRREKQRLGGVR